MNKEILILCVNYNNSNEVISYVKHLSEQIAFFKIQIVVVDNSNDAKEFRNLEYLNSKYSNVRLIDAGINLGYLKGIDFGLQTYLSTNAMPNWIVISNTDIELENEKFFCNLLDLYPKGFQGMIAPSIYSTGLDKDQNPYAINRFSKEKLKFLRFIYKSTLLTSFADLILRSRRKFFNANLIYTKTENRNIYAPHGAFILLNKKYFEKGGDLKYQSFLFCEEIYLGEVSKKIGTKVFYDKRLKVYHNEHSTISLVKKKNLLKFSHDSVDYCLKKFY